MKLFLISQDENDDYDTYDSAVVCAADERGAKLIHPDGCGEDLSEWEKSWGTWASTPDNVSAQYVGEAAPDVKPGVVCSSFNAG